MKLFMNHIGYETQDTKSIMCQGTKEETIVSYGVFTEDGTVVMESKMVGYETVSEWNDYNYWNIDFSAIEREGNYYIQVNLVDQSIKSKVFEIRKQLHSLRLMNAMRCYFKGQRVSGEWLQADKQVGFWGEKSGCVDLHGGWFDATGDYGVHMSHLSYSGVFSPNQTPLLTYILFDSMEMLETNKATDCQMLIRHLMDEAFWGADYLMRLRAPSGSFYRSIDRGGAFVKPPVRAVDYDAFVDGANRVPDMSLVNENITDANYEVGFRTGGGMAIAALAYAARYPYSGSEYQPIDYIKAAQESFEYLMKHNELQVNDGTWNLLDEYCALIAAVELYETTHIETYYEEAKRLATLVKKRTRSINNDLWFEAQPGHLYFHPVEEGMPIIALLKYASIEKDKKRKQSYIQVATLAMDHVVNISKTDNPFFYARYTIDHDTTVVNRFFFPHDTSAAPWWQGENARLASLASAAGYLAKYVSDCEKRKDYLKFACRQLDWIMGLNPFDACMIDGFGHNNIQYFFENQYDFMNCPGGICNGITSGLQDKGIAFITQPTEEIKDNWRWAEQWLPHGSWFLYAIVLKLINR